MIVCISGESITVLFRILEMQCNNTPGTGNIEQMNKLTDIWDERYFGSEYVYGEQPNNYLKEQLEKLPVGHILFVGEGEGRNAVYAAGLGWKVSAYDISAEGKKKAQQLADRHSVQIDYRVGELHDVNFEKEQFDVIVLIFVHFPEDERASIHRALSDYLHPGGMLILEAFSKNHTRYQAVNPNAGGPKDIAMLYSVDDLKNDFRHFKIIELKETEVYLSEGTYHNGLSAVVRFTGRKKDSGNADLKD